MRKPRKPTARELVDRCNRYHGTAEPGSLLATRVEAVLDYCDEGFHECIAEHLKEIKRLLNGEKL